MLKWPMLKLFEIHANLCLRYLNKGANHGSSLIIILRLSLRSYFHLPQVVRSGFNQDQVSSTTYSGPFSQTQTIKRK